METCRFYRFAGTTARRGSLLGIGGGLSTTIPPLDEAVLMARLSEPVLQSHLDDANVLSTPRRDDLEIDRLRLETDGVTLARWTLHGYLTSAPRGSSPPARTCRSTTEAK